MTSSPARQRDLLVTAFTPTLSNGRGVRTYGVTAALARHAPVEVAYVPFDGAEPSAEFQRLQNVTFRRLNPSRGVRRALRYLSARREGVPEDLARVISPELSSAADGAPDEVRVIADYISVAAALLPLSNRREVIYLANNLESGFRDDSAGLLRRLEQTVLRSFAECWMVTRADEQGAVALGGEHVRTRYVPNVVDLSLTAPLRPRGSSCVSFVGDFTYPPNREGLDFLVGEVLPRAWQRRPDLRLKVAGRGLAEIRFDPRVDVLGFVQDLREVYAATDVVAVPLLSGGGSPLKFVQGLACGLPVIATQHAAKLLEMGVPGRDFIAAASPDEFARALVELTSDLQRAAALGAAGRELAARCYSVDALATLLAR